MEVIKHTHAHFVGKLYVFTRIVKVDAVPDENICELEDNWGSPIVKDSEYKK